MPRRLPTRVQEGRQAIQEEVGLYQKGHQDELSAGKILVLRLFKTLQSVILRLEIENCDPFFCRIHSYLIFLIIAIGL